MVSCISPEPVQGEMHPPTGRVTLPVCHLIKSKGGLLTAAQKRSSGAVWQLVTGGTAVSPGVMGKLTGQAGSGTGQ